jgi:hypothetical protein
MRLKWDAIKRLWPFGILVTVAVAIAAVPGFFTTVNATTGFLVNGSGGTLGYALCSDGTYYDVPCSVSGTGITTLTGPVTASGSGSVVSTITPTGVTATSYIGANITVNAAGQITAATSGFSSGNNSNGYWVKDSSGFIHEWGNILGSCSIATGTQITFPTAFTNAGSISAVAMSNTVHSDGIGFISLYSGTLNTTGFEVEVGAESCTDGLYWTAEGF